MDLDFSKDTDPVWIGVHFGRERGASFEAPFAERGLEAVRFEAKLFRCLKTNAG